MKKKGREKKKRRGNKVERGDGGTAVFMGKRQTKHSSLLGNKVVYVQHKVRRKRNACA